MGTRPTCRDFIVAADPLSRFLGPGASRRLGRHRHRRERTLCELERTAADLIENPIAGHLLLGLRDLADRGRAVPDDRIPVAAPDGEIKGGAGRRNPRRYRHRLRDCRAGPVPLGLSRLLPAAPRQQEDRGPRREAVVEICRRHRLHRHSRRGVTCRCAGFAADAAERTGLPVSRSHPAHHLRRDRLHADRDRIGPSDPGQASWPVRAWTTRSDPRTGSGDRCAA